MQEEMNALVTGVEQHRKYILGSFSSEVAGLRQAAWKKVTTQVRWQSLHLLATAPRIHQLDSYSRVMLLIELPTSSTDPTHFQQYRYYQ